MQNDVVETATEAVTDTAQTFIKWVCSFMTWSNLFKVVGAVLVLFIFWIIYKVIIRSIKKIKTPRFTANKSMIAVKIVKYAFYIIALLYILNLFGINVSAIWGAAGIAGVALAFAAQTSVSNVISGVFLIVEKSIHIGDFITVGGQSGIVDTVGLLSVRIHTLDNHMIRIPNSTIIDSNLVNVNYFPVRRLTMQVSISYEDDIEKGLSFLENVPLNCKTVLKDPAPLTWVESFGESRINLTLAVWFNNADYIKTRNDVFIETKKIFDKENISIPYNKLDVKILDDKTSLPVVAKKSTSKGKTATRASKKITK